MRNYAEFWPHYLREHAKPATRALHYAGTSGVIALAVAAVATGRPLWLVALPVCGYFFAWLGHFAVERNRPATFRHPAWSLVSDFRMFALGLSGRLGRHLEEAGVRG